MKLIDANKLLNIFENTDYDVCESFTGAYCGYGFSIPLVRKVLEDAPSVDAVPVKHAYWKSLPNKLARTCSSCEHDEPDKFGDMDVNIFNYCSYCGAKMDGRQNG